MATIPEATLDELRGRADIVAVIGEHVQLRKAGRNWKGLCPFHGEKSPSFNVSPDKGFFYCFGCQKKGDVLTFVMEYQGKSFIEAVEQLAARFGVALPRVEESPEQRRARGERAAMLALNKVATQFFRDTLAHAERGAPGRAYLARRGTSDELVARFQLGYAPGEWGALADHLTAQGADLELATRLGLVAPRPSGGYYDRYRERLVCPVIVPGGDVVGFSARIVEVAGAPPPTMRDGSPPPKYINSPESTVYKKGKLLFGLAQAREAMAAKKRAVLVEGNFDVISLHQAGITETVAPLGTALTPEQVDALRRLTDEVVLCYDGDRAGKSATRGALELLVAADVPVRVIVLPDGDDPDALVKRDGPAALEARIKAAQGGIEFYCFETQWGTSRNTADGHAATLDEAARFIAKVANRTKRELLVGTLATAMGVERGVVENAIARLGRGPQAPSPRGPLPPATEPGPGPHAAPAGGRDRAPPHHEVELIGLFADHPRLLATADADRAFSLLTDSRLRAICSAARAGQTFHELAPDLLPAPTASTVLSGRYAAETQAEKVLHAMLDGLEQLRRNRVIVGDASRQTGAGDERDQLRTQLAEAQRRGDRDLARKLAAELVSSRK